MLNAEKPRAYSTFNIRQQVQHSAFSTFNIFDIQHLAFSIQH